jgi:hypothetical protein
MSMMVGGGFFLSGLFVVVAYMTAQTSAAIMGRYVLWFGAASLALLLVIAGMAYQANLTAAPSLGASPWLALLGWLCVVLALAGRMIWRLSSRANSIPTAI